MATATTTRTRKAASSAEMADFREEMAAMRAEMDALKAENASLRKAASASGKTILKSGDVVIGQHKGATESGKEQTFYMRTGGIRGNLFVTTEQYKALKLNGTLELVIK